MFGGMESASVAMVMARRESMPINVQRPKSPLGKTYSLPPAVGVSDSVFLLHGSGLSLLSFHDPAHFIFAFSL